MPLTREERLVIEELIKRVARLDSRISDLEQQVETLNEFAARVDSTNNFLDLTDAEKIAAIRDAVNSIVASGTGPLRKHDHTNDQEGGDCFATKGANLID